MKQWGKFGGCQGIDRPGASTCWAVPRTLFKTEAHAPPGEEEAEESIHSLFRLYMKLEDEEEPKKIPPTPAKLFIPE